MIRVGTFQLVSAVLVFAGSGCGGSTGGSGGGSAQSVSLGFADAMVRAIRSPDGENVRSVMAPKSYIFGAQIFIDLRSPEERYRQYEEDIRRRIVKVQDDLAAKGFRWQTCKLASANILLANVRGHPTPPAVQQLYSRVTGDEKVETAELLPAIVPLVEGQEQHGIVFLFLDDGAQEAVVRVNSMPTKQGRRIALLSPVIEVQSVRALGSEQRGG